MLLLLLLGMGRMKTKRTDARRRDVAGGDERERFIFFRARSKTERIEYTRPIFPRFEHAAPATVEQY